METKVSISTDIALILYPPLTSMHDYAPAGPVPPLPPPTPTGFACELPVTFYWPPSVLMGKAQLTSTVLHGGFAFALESHDCGPMIPHIQFVPHILNVLTFLHILKAKRQANFSAGEVKANGKPIAHCLLANSPPTPMTSCGKPVSNFLTGAPTSHRNTLLVGVHFVDLIAGWLTIAANLAFECVAARGAAAPSVSSTSPWGPISDELGDWAMGLINGGQSDLFGETIGAGGDASGRSQRLVVGNVTGAVRLAGQLLGVYHGDARLGLTSEAGPYSVGLSYSRDGATHRNTVGATQGVRGPLGTGGLGLREEVSFDSDGGDVQGQVQGVGNLGGASRDGTYNTSDGWSTSGSWPNL